MRPGYSSITPDTVHTLARQTLEACLKWKPFRDSVTARDVVDLLLLIAVTGSSLFAVVRRRFSFSHETGRQAVYSQLDGPDAVADGLARSLHHVLSFSRPDRRRRWLVAIDTHNCPYYGDRSTPGIIGGQKKQGTKYFFGYATAILIHKRRRYTVGLIPVLPRMKPHEIVEALLRQLDRHGLTVRGMALDSGFDSGETLLLLQERGLDYTVPLRRKGRGTNRRNACFAWPTGTVGRLDWKTDKTNRPVSTDVLVWRRKNQPETRVFAFAGWGAAEAVNVRRRAWLARRRYRERFGIETSYRQKNQGKGMTTARDATYRLLLEGLAHLLRQVWVLLTEQIARAGRRKPTDWIGELTLPMMLEWLDDVLKSLHADNRSIPLDDNDLRRYEHR